MRPRSRIQTTGQNNGHQLRDYSKSSNRSENRPLIFLESGNQDFEVRSNNQDIGLEKGQTIQVDEYEVKYKYK